MGNPKHPSQPPPGGERRQDDRHFACFPANVERDEGETRSAVIRDLSVSGTMLLTRAKLNQGDRVRLSLYISRDLQEARVVTGSVVRSDRWGDGTGFWPYSVAVQFDEPATEYQDEIRVLAEEQKKLGFMR